MSDALSGSLAAAEAQVPNLRPHAAKRIDWAGEAGAVTPLSVVYIHGFSASAHELSPVPEQFAQALGANLFVTRLTGHGQDGAALGRARLADWRADMRQARDIARKIGQRAILMGNSTGATLIALSLLEDQNGVAGAAMIAPNFAIRGALTRFALGLPGARHWLPLLAGRERSFPADNPEHAAHWTLRYPSRVVVEVHAATRAVARADLGRITVPGFFAFTETDEVVDPAATHRAMARWGGEVTHLPMTMGPGDDARGHLVAGDIMSPGQTDGLVAALSAWGRGLSEGS